MKKKNIIKIFSLIIFILCIISGINFKNIIKNLKPNSNQQEVKKDIEFETYFLDGEKIKILATAQDTENLLSTLEEYENGKLIKKIDCNNKEKVTVDIESDGDANYEFIATNTLGEKISKELVINDELRKNTIKIDISIDENTLDSNGLALKGNVKIDYGNNSNLKMKTQYKIGNSEWKEYNEIIDIDCNDIVSNQEQEKDNENIIIYARKIDDSGNQIFNSIKTNQFDVDAPVLPEISIEQKAEYPIITADGICLDNTVTIKFDQNQTNLLNQYSTDGGKTWETCDTGVYTFNTLKGIVYAKSTKETGLTITKMVNVSMANVTSSSALAPDALNYKAYDGNNSTYVGAYQPNHMSLYPPPEIKSIGGNMMVDESAINKTLNISFSRTGGGSGSSAPNGEIRIYSYDENNSIISTKIINKNQSGIRNETIQIPENTKKMYFYMIMVSSGWGGGEGYARIHNIEVLQD